MSGRGRGGKGRGGGGGRGKGRGGGGGHSRQGKAEGQQGYQRPSGPRVPKHAQDTVTAQTRSEREASGGHAHRDTRGDRNADRMRTKVSSGSRPRQYGNKNGGDGESDSEGEGNVRLPKGSARPRRDRNHRRGGYGSGGRNKPLYKSYVDEAAVEAGLADGTFVKGSLRVNARNYREAYVSVPGMVRDVHIEGMSRRNRAFNGDIVVVRLLHEYDQTPKRKGKGKGKGDNGDKDGNKKTDDRRASHASMTSYDDSNDDNDHDDNNNGNDDSNLLTPPAKSGPPSGELGNTPAYPVANPDEDPEPIIDSGGAKAEEKAQEGTVVFIAEAKHNERLAGRIQGFDPEKERFAQFTPVDKRYPFVYIPADDLRVLRKEDLEKDIVEVRLAHGWGENQRYPKGHFVRAIGRAGDIVAETEAILATNAIDWDVPFSEEVIADLPEVPENPEETWKIPEDELANPMREDLRDLRVISVDPETARDLDDALSVTKNADGNFEIGIHIADVTYFVSPDTALDSEAAVRTTSTYLVQRVVPMLPGLLSQDLCSLNPGVDRLSFSCIVTMTPDAQIVSERFTRSVIRSDCRLSYAQAQRMIEGEYTAAVLKDPSTEYDWKVEEGECTRGQVVEDIRQLSRLARIMRKRRFDGGAVRINKTKLHFKLDPETGDPLEVTGYPIREANQMIEEFMLLANIRVAHHISEQYPEMALLRRHPAPLDRGLDKLVASLRAAGYPMDVSTTKKLMESLDDDRYSKEIRDILHIIVARPMRPAAYFCTGDPSVEAPDGWRHWALNVSHYTHFTSPIRRYPDVVVHRLLYASLIEDRIRNIENGTAPPCGESPEELRERKPKLHEMVDLVPVAERCNENKLAAKKSSEMSGVLYLCLMLKDRGPMKLRASVFDLWDGGLAVVVREYTLEYRLKADTLQAESFTYRAIDHTAHIVDAKVITPAPEGSESAQPSIEVIQGERVIKLFDEVDIELVVRTDRTPMDFGVRFLGFVDK